MRSSKRMPSGAVGVSGCSRFGKGAFTIGALDQRIALILPIESGSGGVPIWRGIPGEMAERPSSAHGETYWLGDAFGSFTSGRAAGVVRWRRDVVLSLLEI
ncbi:glucuronyl esterase domain-containing protein [Sorangium sp. So ce1153]|uniref:glucuronyl esterase domain-containing protein n=1 Tax=Sorangium sp. So ce1153 TaxID=3133333 RepID=UPI003F62EF64